MATTSLVAHRIALDWRARQDHEVRYEAKKEGVPKDAVKKSVKAVGNSRKKVEARLEKRG
jgi:hypothetical protein